MEVKEIGLSWSVLYAVQTLLDCPFQFSLVKFPVWLWYDPSSCYKARVSLNTLVFMLLIHDSKINIQAQNLLSYTNLNSQHIKYSIKSSKC